MKFSTMILLSFLIQICYSSEDVFVKKNKSKNSHMRKKHRINNQPYKSNSYDKQKLTGLEKLAAKLSLETKYGTTQLNLPNTILSDRLNITIDADLSEKMTRKITRKWAKAENFVPQITQKNEKTEAKSMNSPYLIISHDYDATFRTMMQNDNIFVSRLIKEAEAEEQKEKEEKKQKEEKLKEYFVSDFNAFIDYASIGKESLDYLELEIPGKVLDYFCISSDNSNDECMFVHRPSDDHLCVSGYNKYGPYCSFSGTKFQLNDNKSCDLIEHCVSKTEWQKIFKLNENDTLKFRFYFRQGGKSHQIMIGGQIFSFLFFKFDLLRPFGQRFVCKAAAKFNYFQEHVYQIPYFKSWPQNRVKMLENTGTKFTFVFYISNDFSFRPNFLQNIESNIDTTSLNFQNNLFYTDKNEMSSFPKKNIFLHVV